MIRRGFFRSLAVLASAALLAGTAFAQKKQNITVKGSDTMVLVAQKWAEVYQNAHKDVAIQVTGGGSGVGIAALINNTCAIANSSRSIKGSEIKLALQGGVDPKEFKVALDAICVVVNKDNPLNEISMEQLMSVFIGAANSWDQVGGGSGSIIRYTRENNSGTYVFFKEHVLKNKDYAPDCQTMPGTAAVADAVGHDPKGIGYGGVAYFLTRPDCKILKIKKDAASPGTSPVSADGKTINYNVIYDGSYAISRYLFCYTPGSPKGDVKTYLDWIVGPEGQKVAKEEGYIPLPN